jgi:hypothetical protein
MQPLMTKTPSLVLIGFALSIGSCKTTDAAHTEFCKTTLSAPSPNFPSFVEDTGAGESKLGFQVCDSKVVDLNGDGLLDFVAADHIGPGFGYYMQMPGDTVRFAEGQKVAFVNGANSAGIVVDDFNKDGIPDVANSDHPGAVTIRINMTPPGSPIDKVSFPDEGETNVDLDVTHGHHFGFAGVEGGLINADFNGDGKVDLATSNLGANSAGKNTASFMFNTTPDGAPKATFTEPQYLIMPGPAISIDSADFDGDGLPDVVTSNTGVSSLSILTNKTAQVGAASTPTAAPEGESAAAPAEPSKADFEILTLTIPAPDDKAGAGPTNPVAADFNNDGKPDVVTANWNVDTVTLFTNTTQEGGETSFAPEPFIVELCFNPLVARAGDLDGDGDMDIAVVPLQLDSAIGLGIIENQLQPGSDIPSLALVQLIELPQRLRPVTFGEWLEGKGDGQSPGTWFTSTGNAADFDGDGKLDLVIAAAHGHFSIEMRGRVGKTNDIVDFVEPKVSLHLAQQFLPKHTELVLYRR